MKKNACKNRGWSRRGWRCSTVIPEGLLAAPRLADRRLREKRPSSKLKCTRYSGCAKRRGSGVRGCCGPLAGSLNALSVSSVPGARDAPSSACRAKDNSSMWTRESVLSTHPPLYAISVDGTRQPLGNTQGLLPRDLVQAPLLTCSNRWSNLASLDHTSSGRSVQQHSGQKQNELPSPRWSALILCFDLFQSLTHCDAPRNNRGTDFITQVRSSNFSTRATSSRDANADLLVSAAGK